MGAIIIFRDLQLASQATLATASQPRLRSTHPTDPDDYLYPALNANANVHYVHPLERRQGNYGHHEGLGAVLRSNCPLQEHLSILPQTVVAGGPTVTFPNSDRIRQHNSRAFSAHHGLATITSSFPPLLQGDSTYHLFQVNLQPTAGQSIIFQLTAGPGR